MPVFFTAVTIFDDSIFTGLRRFRTFSSDVTVSTAVVTYRAVWALAGNVALLVAFVAQSIFQRHGVDFLVFFDLNKVS